MTSQNYSLDAQGIETVREAEAGQAGEQHIGAWWSIFFFDWLIIHQ